MHHTRRTHILVLAISFLLIFPLANAYSSPSPDSAMTYLKTLSNPDLFHGRKTGLAGGKAAQTWIAQQYQRWDLKPLVGDQFLIPFPMLVTREERAQISLNDPRYEDVTLRLGEDFTACTNSGSGQLTAPVSLVGHGISRPEKGWDDYGDTDVSGRILVIFRGAPNGTEDWNSENQRTYLTNEAVKHGAVAVFYYQSSWPVEGAAINKDAYAPNVPVGYIGESALRLLLFNSGESVESYKASLKKHPRILNLDREMTLDFKVEQVPNGTGYDVAGVVPGTDPKLSQEAIVIGGHSDHAGRNALGQVYPGADDNGSGASVVMELARYYVSHPQKRTLVFCNFGGEEQGLLGSRALAPILPETYHYVAMLNLDMVGRGEGQTGFGGGDQLGEIWNPWFAALPDSMKGHFFAGRAWGGEASDHAPFRNAGIPAFTIWSMGSHPFYHRPDDSFATIQPAAIQGTIAATSAWIGELANVDRSLAKLDLPQRTIWHQGAPFVHVKASKSIEKDMNEAAERAQQGWMGTILQFTYPSDNQTHDAFLAKLEDIREVLHHRFDVLWGEGVSDFLKNARRAKGTIVVEMNADEITPADTVRMLEWADEGLSILAIDDPPEWLEGEDLTPEQDAFVQVLKSRDLGLEFPLEAWEESPAVLSALGSQVYVTSTLKQFAKTPDELLDQIHKTGARMVVTLRESEIKRVPDQMDRLARCRAQVQPARTSYADALEWVKACQDKGVSNETLVDWLAGNMRLW